MHGGLRWRKTWGLSTSGVRLMPSRPPVVKRRLEQQGRRHAVSCRQLVKRGNGGVFRPRLFQLPYVRLRHARHLRGFAEGQAKRRAPTEDHICKDLGHVV